MNPSHQESAMYRTSTTFLMVENDYRRERARRAFREQQGHGSWHRTPRGASAAGARGWRRVLHLRPALPH